MAPHLTKDSLAVVILLVLLGVCAGSYVLYVDRLRGTQPLGSYPPGWIFPLLLLDAFAIVLASLAYFVLSERLPSQNTGKSCDASARELTRKDGRRRGSKTPVVRDARPDNL